LETKPWVPEVLKQGSKGMEVRVWTFLYLNQPQSFTAKEIANYLDAPLSTVQQALKKLRTQPKIRCEDVKTPYKGRRQKRYTYSERKFFFP